MMQLSRKAEKVGESERRNGRGLSSLTATAAAV